MGRIENQETKKIVMKVLLILPTGYRPGDKVYSKIAELPPGLSPVEGLVLQDGRNQELVVEQVGARLYWRKIPESKTPVLLHCRYIRIKRKEITHEFLSRLGWKEL